MWIVNDYHNMIATQPKVVPAPIGCSPESINFVLGVLLQVFKAPATDHLFLCTLA